MARSRSLLHDPNPVVRETYQAHLLLYLLWAPFIALIRYAPFLAVETFNASAWVAPLAAVMPASNLLAVFFSGAISRSNKTTWVVRPLILANLTFLLILFVDREKGWMFALVIIFAQAFRSPIIAALSAIFRTNYPPKSRSSALAIPMAIQMSIVSLFAIVAGLLFDIDEGWVTITFIVAAFLGIAGAWRFRNVEAQEPVGGNGAGGGKGKMNSNNHAKAGFFDQFRTVLSNRNFLQYELAYLLFGSGSVAIMTVMPLYLKEWFDPTHTQASLIIVTLPFLSTALTFPLWGRMLDRFNPLVMRAFFNGVWCLVPLVLFVAPKMGIALMVVCAAQLISGLVRSGSMLIWWLGVNYFARAHEVATFMSFHQTLTGVRGILTPFVAVMIGQRFGYRASMLVWFTLMFLGFLVMVAEVVREKKSGKLRTFSEQEARLDQVGAPTSE